MFKKAFCFFVLFFLSTTVYAEKNIRVGVVTNQHTAVVFANNKVAMTDSSGRNISFIESGKDNIFSVENGFIKINENNTKYKSIILRSNSKDDFIKVNNRFYRGFFKINILPGNKSLNAVNVLPVDEYLYSSVSNEVLPLWPEEAIKAQAVVSRTNALYYMKHPLHKDYDINAFYNEANQVYYGVSAEKDFVKDNINATTGEVVLFKGALIKAYFTLSSGGQTEEVKNISYLKSVLDYDTDYPDYLWERSFKAEEIEQRLNYAGYGYLGKFQGFEFSPHNKNATKQANDRGKSGRLKEIKILGEKGYAVIEGDLFCKIFGFPSSAFDMTVANLVPQYVDLPITDRFGNVIGIKKMLVNVETNKPKFDVNRGKVIRVSWAENEKIFVKGYGSGHGIGYSQWGARGMVNSVSGTTYKDVLKYFYQGTNVAKLY